MILRGADCGSDRIDTDIAIIGGGAAGLSLAAALAGRGRDVVVVESGSIDIDPAWQAGFAAEIVGEPMDAESVRLRNMGGATALWSGRCAPLDADDFAAHDWIPDSGWPITRATLAPFYRQAPATIGFGTRFEHPSPALARAAPMFCDSDVLQPYLWRFFAVRRDEFLHFGDAHWDTLDRAPNARLLYECDCLGLDAGGGREVRSAALVDRNGRRIGLHARTFVLASGCVESVRMLLAGAAAEPNLLGDVRPWLGGGFMQHVRLVAGEIAASSPASARRLQRLFNRFARARGIHDEVGFASRSEWRRERRLGNVSGVLRYDAAGMAAPWHWPAAAVRRARGHEPLLLDPAISLWVDLEQAPSRDSRIGLSEHRDRLGSPRARIDWRIGDLERRTSAAFVGAFERWLAGTGLGSFVPAGGVRDGALPRSRLLDSLHPLGGARMSRDAATGVVDADLRVHGSANLYLCGGAVFPTGGHANPTMTIVALALRLADQIARRS